MANIKFVLICILIVCIFPIIIFIIEKNEKNIKLSNKKKRLEAEEKDRLGRARMEAHWRQNEEILKKLILFLETQKSKTELIFGDNFDEEVLRELEILALFNDGYFNRWGDEFETTLAKVLKEGGLGAIPSDKQSILNLLEKCRDKLKNDIKMEQLNKQWQLSDYVQNRIRELYGKKSPEQVRQERHNRNTSRNSNWFNGFS